LLRAGGVIALPTETVYGLAADVTHTSAIERIYAIKGRPRDHPLIVHIGAVRDLETYAVDVPAAAHRLAARFWPGPLTMVLRKSASVPDIVSAGQPTVALRMVDHPLTLAILRVFGGAVAAPSANRFGRVSPTSAKHVRDDLGDDVDYIIDGGPCRVGVESTIVDLTGDVPAILRLGAIGASALADALGAPVVVRSGGPVRAPGTLPSHYAPRAELVLTESAAVDAEAARRVAAGQRVAKLTLPDDPAAAARTLYASLRALDAEGNDAIVTALPADDEVHAAVRDRLLRAAAPRAVSVEASAP
jgi:L-threonylcarbamoyladenylate synthase